MDHLRVMWNGVQKVNISSNCFKVMKTTFDMGPEILKWFLIPFSINILNLINRYPRDSIETQCPYTNLAHVNLFHNVNEFFAQANISAISKPYAKIFPHANQEKKSRDTFNFTMQNRRDTS